MSNDQHIACDLKAIGRNERKSHKKNTEELFSSITAVSELTDGYAFHLPAETSLIEKAGSFISRERLCCPFFNFTLEIGSNYSPVRLKMSGNKRVKDFIAQNIIPQLNLDSDDSGRPRM